jgi:hypothetical protein
VLAAATSTVVLMAASVTAGTGIGAVFNLGATNTVNRGRTTTPEAASSTAASSSR